MDTFWTGFLVGVLATIAALLMMTGQMDIDIDFGGGHHLRMGWDLTQKKNKK